MGATVADEPQQRATANSVAPKQLLLLPDAAVRGASGRRCGGSRSGKGSLPARPQSDPSSDEATPSTSASTKVLKRCGSGWGGTRTPTDDFVEQRRKSAWHRMAEAAGRQLPRALPPRVYVDNRTLIREVTDLSTLRRGDHCLIAINLVRCASPVVDRIISCLGSVELCCLYHHFIIVDDVHHVDEQGVPRTSEGKPAMIFECGNTVPEAIEELRVNTTTSGQSWLHRVVLLPVVFGRFVLKFKAKFTCHPLADYGDTPHLYIVLAKQTAEERERTVAEALRLERQQNTYHVIFNNCEHTCNLLRRGVHGSAMVSFALWVLFRLIMGLIGLLALRLNQDLTDFADTCYISCADYPIGAMAVYHLFTTLPVALQAMISYILLMRSVCQQHVQALIDRHDCYHLLGKELGRAIVVGGFAATVIAFTPRVVSGTCARFVVCAFAYAASDAFYNVCAHAVMRLVLLPAYGRVWLFGPKEKDM